MSDQSVVETGSPDVNQDASEVPESASPAAASPTDVAAKAQAKVDKSEMTLEQANSALEKARKDAARYREKLREVEPLAQKQIEEDQAREARIAEALERAEKAEKAHADLQVDNWRLELAGTHHIPPEKSYLIGSGSRKEMEQAAADLGEVFAASQKAPAPPSNRPVEGLRPGASPEPPKPADDSYPTAWAPAYMRTEDQVRNYHGQ